MMTIMHFSGVRRGRWAESEGNSSWPYSWRPSIKVDDDDVIGCYTLDLRRYIRSNGGETASEYLSVFSFVVVAVVVV